MHYVGRESCMHAQACEHLLVTCMETFQWHVWKVQWHVCKFASDMYVQEYHNLGNTEPGSSGRRLDSLPRPLSGVFEALPQWKAASQAALCIIAWGAPRPWPIIHLWISGCSAACWRLGRAHSHRYGEVQGSCHVPKQAGGFEEAGANVFFPVPYTHIYIFWNVTHISMVGTCA